MHVSAALDVVYKPIETKFLKLSRDAGAATFSGLKMLLYQAVDAFELWNEGVKITDQQADEVYRSLMMEVSGARNVILEGFMGSGKSTVSEILSDRLSLDILDTDEAIERTEGRSISEIFKEDGEEAFRDMETELIETLVKDHWRDMVVSLGGGLPIREDNRKLLKEAGKVIYLKVSPEAAYERLKGDDTRPLLKSDDPLGRIRQLQEKRSMIYDEAADIVIDTDNRTPEEVAAEIIDRLGL